MELQKMLNEKGVTLVELLAAIVLTSIIGVIGYNILFSGFAAMNSAKTEAELRNEADLIMATFIEELYTKTTDELEFIKEAGNSYFVDIENPDQKIGFINNQVIVNNRQLTLNDGIRMNEETKIKEIEDESNRYKITISLESTENNQKINTASEIHLINPAQQGVIDDEVEDIE